MSVFITGGAGFIGSHLALRLLNDGHSVTVFDNLLLGKKEFLKPCFDFSNFKFIEADLLDMEKLEVSLRDHDSVFHLAANSDISQGAARSDVDLKFGTIATYNVLECMRRVGATKMVFASSSAIYGEASKKPTPEDYGPLLPISFYGASKLAAETLCSAFANNCDMKAVIFRFANIVGPHATHGAIYDFVQKLKSNSNELKVLGNGTQKKSYLHVHDCVDAMIFGWLKNESTAAVFNLASDGVTSVKSIAEEVVRQWGSQTSIVYGESDRGWVGDVPFTWLDGGRLAGWGWKAKLSSDQAVERAIGEIISESR